MQPTPNVLGAPANGLLGRWGGSKYNRLNPTAIANLAAWYDVSSEAGTTSNLLRIDASNRVSLIADRSGNSPVNALCLNGVAGNSASLADSVPLSITGDIDIQARLAMDDWTPSATQDIVGKWALGGNQRSYLLQVNATNGVLVWNWSTTGADAPFFVSSVAPTVSDLAGLWVRVTMDVDNGSGQHEVRFWTGGNSDTPNWVQLGVTRTGAGTTSIFNSTATLYIGTRDLGGSGNIAARIYRTRIYADLTQTDLRLDANFALAGKLVSSFTESSANAATVTINSSGDLGARICGERDLVQLTASKQPIYLPWSGTNYGWLGGITNNRFNTPFTFAAGQRAYDIAARVSVPAFSTAIGIVGADNTYLAFGITSSNFPYLRIVQDGTGTDIGVTSATAITSVVSVNQNFWLRVVYSQLTGTGSFQYSLDDTNDFSSVSWTTLAAISGGNTVNNGFAITTLAVGSRNQVGTSEVFAGRIFRTRVVVNSTTVDFDPSRYQSGTTFTASTGETWTLNGGATIVTATSLYFDGTDDYMKAAAFSLSQPETGYIVGSQVSFTSGDGLFDGGTGAAYAFQNITSPNVAINAGSTAGNNTGFVLQARALLRFIFNGASSSTRINRNAAVTGNAGANNPNGFTIGADRNGAGATNMTLNEAALYSESQDTATGDRFALYAASKWRISGV